MLPEEREQLNRLTASSEDVRDSELDHFERCPACGQAIDLRRLGDVFHHDEPGHAPLPVN